MALSAMIDPVGIVSINGALRPYRGAAGPLFSAMAKALFVNPLTPRVFAWTADRPGRVERLIANTGSHLDARGIELYRRLFRRPGHVAGALGMMANWDLGDLQRDLPRLRAMLLLVAADGDRAVPPAGAEAVARRVPGSTVERVARLGHLAHEEDPQAFANIVRRFARQRHALEPASSLQ
jgi:magnesium chelatase accessory protein